MATHYAIFHSALSPNNTCPLCHWVNNTTPTGPSRIPGIPIPQAQDYSNQA